MSAVKEQQQETRDSRRGLQRMDEILSLLLRPLGLPVSPGEEAASAWNGTAPRPGDSFADRS